MRGCRRLCRRWCRCIWRRYLRATEDEVTTFVSPLTARSRVREVLHALVGARQLETVVVEGKTLLHIPGGLPAAEGAVASEASGEDVAAVVEKPKKVGTGRISKFARVARSGRQRESFAGSRPRVGRGLVVASRHSGPSRAAKCGEIWSEAGWEVWSKARGEVRGEVWSAVGREERRRSVGRSRRMRSRRSASRGMRRRSPGRRLRPMGLRSSASRSLRTVRRWGRESRRVTGGEAEPAEVFEELRSREQAEWLCEAALCGEGRGRRAADVQAAQL